MSFAIRSYHPTDIGALYDVCLKTGDSGEDATHLYQDRELLGHMYVAPYLAYEPDLAFTLTHNDVPVGYVLGTRDSVVFADRCERDWYPVLRARYPLPPAEDKSRDAGMIRAFHEEFTAQPELLDYPAHLHIDLLPIGQGQGNGRRMIETFLARLRALNVSAVHLGVGKGNERAIRFYEKIGFEKVVHYDHWGWIGYGMRL